MNGEWVVSPCLSEVKDKDGNNGRNPVVVLKQTRRLGPRKKRVVSWCFHGFETKVRCVKGSVRVSLYVMAEADVLCDASG